MPEEKKLLPENEDMELARSKLGRMEEDVKAMADKLDLDREALEKERVSLDKQVIAFNKKHDLIDASDAFNHMVKLVDEIYTMYVLQHGTHAGLYDSIKLLLDARSKFLSEQK